ncbi:MAG: hypothetical protein ACLPPF_10555 [Rhodomicrobium sp.]
MTGRSFFWVFVAYLLCASPVFAQNMLSPAMPMPGFIFAYPGSACPGGSVRYKGPEQALAAESGAVYCRFDKKVKIIPKMSGNTACPPGTAPYVDAKAKPDPDVMWCK